MAKFNFPQCNFFKKPAMCKARFPTYAFVLLLLFGESASVPVLKPATSTELSQEFESLAFSKILKDPTSSRSTVENLDKITTQALVSPPLSLSRSKIFSNVVSGNTELPNAHTNLNNGKGSLEIISQLHVAQCRATCLQKFHLTTNSFASPTSLPAVNPDSSSTSSQYLTWEDDIDEIQLLPKIFRLRRKRSSGENKDSNASNPNKKISWNCLQDSEDCFSCWKTCQLLSTEGSKMSNSEVTTPVPSAASSTSSPVSIQKAQRELNEVLVGDGTNDKQNFSGKHFTRVSKQESSQTNLDGKGKQPTFALLACSSNSCIVGCQVACNFFERHFAKNGENEGNGWKMVTTVDPVVATKHESGAVKIVPGKISWSSSPGLRNSLLEREKDSQKNDNDTRKMIRPSPVVYVVIQEYPDRKWRQIAQTANNELEIPTELSFKMEAKLKSVRVLVVGPEGLLSVYSGSDESASSEKIYNQEKIIYTSKAGVENTPTPSMKSSSQDSMKKSESDGDVTREPLVTKPDYSKNIDDDVSAGNNESFQVSLESTTTSGNPYTSAESKDSSVSKDLFGLKVVSLIHQKSLVIAELKWNEIGDNPAQEYLITWELTGGGLKGHLVTDSTTVTLSLWPDTKYLIQVGQFQQFLDSDGEQPAETSPSSLKSLPLTVYTSEASSHPLGKSSALFTSDEGEKNPFSRHSEYEYHQDEDEYGENGNETGIEEEASPHKSIMGLQSLSLVLAISVCATILVLLLLTITAFTWTRLKTYKKVECFSCCFTSGEEPHLLSFEEDLSTDDYSRSAIHSFDSPMAFVVGLKKSLRNHKRHNIFPSSFGSSCPEKLAGCESEVPVAMISSSSSTSTSNSLLHCYMNNVWNNQSGLPSPTSSSTLVCSNPVKVASSKSLSLSSERETTALAVAAGVLKASEQHCSSSSSNTLPSNSNNATSKRST